MPHLRSTDFHFFDSSQEVVVVERDLPHWLQAGAVYFITWRTWDSIPADKLACWEEERQVWLARFNGRADILPDLLRKEYQRLFSRRWERWLDACHGECLLRNQDLRSIVASSIKHFDGERYQLTDFVVMPNHVHVLAAFPNPEQMLAQCRSWKKYTANRINQTLGRVGRFWQVDGFDHLVRSPEDFEKFRNYIACNPIRANLPTEQFTHYSLPLNSQATQGGGLPQSE
jgi:REP element-mobilizing transposase RayT